MNIVIVKKRKEIQNIMKQTGKKILIILSIVAVFFLLFNFFGIFSDVINSGGEVVTKISVTPKGFNQVALKFNFAHSSGGYSVRNVSEDEGEYTGDGMQAYDGSLGKYRILVKFGDVGLSRTLALSLRIDKILAILPAKLKTKIVYPEDHGFVMYIGSNTPISVEQIDNGDLKEIGGKLVIPIKLNGK